MRRIAESIVLVPIIVLSAMEVWGTDKNFWYGMYNVPPYREVFNELHNRYKMNWVLSGINDAQVLQNLKSAGLQAMSGPYRYLVYPELDPNFNKIGVYSDEFFLRLRAEGDTAAFQWDPSDGSVTIVTTNGRLYHDPDPGTGDVWSFDPALEQSGRVMIYRHKDFTSNRPGEINLHCRVKANASSSPTPLAYLYLRKWNDSTLKYDTLYMRTILRSEFATTGYLVPDRQISTANEVPPWHTDIVLDWAGTAPMWVDWLGYNSPDGAVVGKGDADVPIRGFVQTYGFSGDEAILGFNMAEELWSDGNVYVQKRVDSLIKSVYPNQKGWTENHYLEWWGDRSQFGGRSAASARLQGEQHMTTLLYPYTGFYPYGKVLSKQGLVTVPSMAAVAGPPNCPFLGSDTAICSQMKLDSVGIACRLYKEFSDSIGARFMPYVQAFSEQRRPIPSSCNCTSSDKSDTLRLQVKTHFAGGQSPSGTPFAAA